MGEKWNMFKAAVVAKFKNYGLMIVKYGVILPHRR
jgi:hypothetical protein